MLLDDLADLLSSGGITTTAYRGFMPEQPDDAIQLIETGGMAPLRAMAGSAGTALERPGVQIVRRSPSYERARVEMQVIWRMLDGLGDRTLNGTRYLWFAASQQPFPLGRDDSNRTLIAMNVGVVKDPSTATST